ncbi:MAG TPA: polysaccharide biosynthesis/export family protein, partial [Ktedonobacteraceae bacterium]|nr:polysaccharide biosynthesis/export family protein [Ktedonobacteraceae bacterium]
MHIAMGVLTLYVVTLAAQTMNHVHTDPIMQEDSYVLGANDRIIVRCVNADEFSPVPVRIDNDGQVTLPFVGRIQLAGLTISDAEKQLTERLSKFIQHPQIQLNVVESHSQPVSVLGAVRNPG